MNELPKFKIFDDLVVGITYMTARSHVVMWLNRVCGEILVLKLITTDE